MHLELVDEQAPVSQRKALIQVFGVGGGGCNAVNRMIEQNVSGVDFIAANTDIQALKTSKAATKLALGSKLTNGLGAGGNPKIGQQSAEEDSEAIRELVMSAQMVFITAGMGGGTGTGAAPVIAQIARECGVLSVGVVTLPFSFEGKPKMRLAEEGVAELRKHVDTIVTIPNQVLLKIVPDMPIMEAFLKADEILRMGVQGIADLITQPGYINVDFNDVRAIMTNGGTALMGIGLAKGEDRATKAALAALSNPLLSGSNIRGASGVLVQITGDEHFSLSECEVVMEKVHEQIGSESVSIISGMSMISDFPDGLRVTIIATGFSPADYELGTPAREGEPKKALTAVAAPKPEPKVEVKPATKLNAVEEVVDNFGPEAVVNNIQDVEQLLRPAFLRRNFHY